MNQPTINDRQTRGFIGTSKQKPYRVLEKALLSICLLTLGAAVALFTQGAVAATAQMSWTNATQNEGGTPLTDLVETNVYYELCSVGVTTSSPSVVVPAPAESIDVTVGPGEWCFVATHVNSEGTASVVSNMATKIVPNPAPLPPGNLTVSNLVAYSIVEQEDLLVMLPVGTVPVGTACDKTQMALGKYVVPRDAVIFSGNVEPLLNFADCG